MDVIDIAGLDQLLHALQARGYRTRGPVARDAAIVYDDLRCVADLPQGKVDEQNGGHYRLIDGPRPALFDYVVGPLSWKKFLFPPEQTVFRAHQERGQLVFVAPSVDAEKQAFIGVRACELHAIQIQDKVFMHSGVVDTGYAARRANTVIVAVNCGRAGGTCFCTSMNTGPAVAPGYDIALTEVFDGDQHYFTVESGTAFGAAVLAEVVRRPARPEEKRLAADIVQDTAAHMGRQLDTTDLPALLMRQLDHPQWQAVAERCLSCGNCTMVCPTCFCSTVTDSTDLAAETAERTRHWDSCFNQDFSYIAGGSVRVSTASRYRQWLTHKFSSWHEQFDSSGCVGCGRCVTWCPVGIDVTQELAAIAATDSDGGTTS